MIEQNVEGALEISPSTFTLILISEMSEQKLSMRLEQTEV